MGKLSPLFLISLVLILVVVDQSHPVESQFLTYCTGGCVRPHSFWQSPSQVEWPASFPKTTPICNATAEEVFASFVNSPAGGCSTSTSILGQYIWARLNSGSGACKTATSQSAMNNIGNAIAAANNGSKSYPPYFTPTSTNPLTGGCDGGYAQFDNVLKSSTVSTSLGQTLCRYNNGILYGPCPCDENGDPIGCKDF